MPRTIRLGVITDEFFDLSLGRMGGFGWAARQLSRIFTEDPSLGVELVYLSGELKGEESKAHGSRVVLRRSTRLGNMMAARREGIDLLITIDYNQGYSVWLRSLPRTPAIVWVRDPRGPAEAARVNTTRIPGAPNDIPQGLFSFDQTSMTQIARESRLWRRPLLFAIALPKLVERLEGTFGFEPSNVYLLPNPVGVNPAPPTKRAKPSVVFLARLDPYKRPWIFAELARYFPQVDFHILGQAHFTGLGAWQPKDLPPNIHFAGHVDGDEKQRLLKEAWVLINTSIHEGLAVSMIEALAWQTPILSSVNPGYVVSRYGIYTGRFDGDGMDAMGAFRIGLEKLLNNRTLREDLGKKGQEWVGRTHTRERFIESFLHLCEVAGVKR